MVWTKCSNQKVFWNYSTIFAKMSMLSLTNSMSSRTRFSILKSPTAWSPNPWWAASNKLISKITTFPWMICFLSTLVFKIRRKRKYKCRWKKTRNSGNRGLWRRIWWTMQLKMSSICQMYIRKCKSISLSRSPTVTFRMGSISRSRQQFSTR